MSDDMRTCPECGEDAKPVIEASNRRVDVIKCPLCGAQDEAPKY